MALAFSRRAVLRDGAISAAGLATAALLGCRGSTGETGEGSGTTGGAGVSQSGGSGEGAPKNIKRAPGVNPNVATVPVNNRKVIQGGVYRTTSTSTTTEFDPDIIKGSTDIQIMNDRLLYANGYTMELTNDLLTSYETVDKQGLEMVFKIRPGVKTYNRPPVNGRIFTAKDVAYSLHRKSGILNPKEAVKYARAGQYVGLEKAEAVDDVTVRLKFSAPNAAFMNALSDPRGQMIPVEQDTIGYKDPTKFVGTGAFMETEFVEGTRQVYKANPDYYRKWDEGGRPGFDTWEVSIVADRASTLAAYISNQISYVSGILPEEEQQLKSSAKDSQFFVTPGPTWDMFSFNVENPLFKDKRVLKAFSLALNYQELADPLAKGWIAGAVTHSMFPESLGPEAILKLPGWNLATKQQDIAEAVKMMDAAGYKEGAGMVFKYENSGAPNDTQVRVRDQLRAIWPKMDPKLNAGPDSAAFQGRLQKGDWEARRDNHTSVSDIVLDMRTYWHSDAVTSGRNYMRYSEKYVDDALDKLLTVPTAQERKAIVQPLIKRMYDEGVPLIILRHPPDNFALHGDVGGYDMTTGPWAYPSYTHSRRWLWRTEL
jgi:ABC-type transport system substrate-binding protein